MGKVKIELYCVSEVSGTYQTNGKKEMSGLQPILFHYVEVTPS